MPTYEDGGYSIEIDWSCLDRIAGQVEGARERTAELIAFVLEGHIKKEATIAQSGQLRAGWRAESKGVGEYVVGTPNAYAAYVNDGTRPHAAPMSAIRAWAEFRGIPWFPVWLSILEKGTEANPYIDRSIELTERQIPALMNQAIGEKMRT